MASENIRGHQIESWVLYSVGVVLILLRLGLRVWKLRIRKLKFDDYCEVFIMISFTMLAVSQVYIVTNHIIDPSASVDSAVNQTILISKVSVILEQGRLHVIYPVKACVLIMVSRLITALKMDFKKLLLAASIYCIMGYTASQIACWTTCLGADQWAYPPPTVECATYTKYLIIELLSNVTSDMLILAIIIPILIKTQLPRSQKALLFLFYSTGIFIIAAAVTTKVYQFTYRDVYDSSWAYVSWYMREVAVAVYISNLPIIIPILHEARHNYKSSHVVRLHSQRV